MYIYYRYKSLNFKLSYNTIKSYYIFLVNFNFTFEKFTIRKLSKNSKKMIIHQNHYGLIMQTWTYSMILHTDFYFFCNKFK